MIKVYLGYRNIDEILKLLKKKVIYRTPLSDKVRPGMYPGLECRGPWANRYLQEIRFQLTVSNVIADVLFSGECRQPYAT